MERDDFRGASRSGWASASSTSRPAATTSWPTPSAGIAAILLGAGCVVWATAPPVHKGLANLALIVAICGVAGGALRLILAGVPVPEDSFLLPAPAQAWLRFLELLRQVPWEEGAVIGLVWLEVLHPSRPWHTAFLGAALIAYLLATHLAESDAAPGTLRPQVRGGQAEEVVVFELVKVQDPRERFEDLR